MSIEQSDLVHGGLRVATLTVSNGPTNVLDLDHCRRLTERLQRLKQAGDVRVVVLRGAGKRFSTGVDIRQHTPDMMPTLLPAFHAVFDALWALPAVTVAAVHGHCLGGAAELVLACDRVIVDATARIGFPEIQVGCYPPVAIAMMPDKIGLGRAAEMILGGGEIANERLEQWGLVHRVAPAGGIEQALTAELDLLAGKSSSVIGMVAALLHDQARRRWKQAIDRLEAIYLSELLPHPDAAEGIAAFVEKRVPVWA